MNELEQAPNPSSRVRLIEERDALGVPRVQLEWRLSPLDKRTLWKGHRLLARALGRAVENKDQWTINMQQKPNTVCRIRETSEVAIELWDWLINGPIPIQSSQEVLN